MLRPGHARRRIKQTLNAAYGDGLLSQRTLMHRLHVLSGSDLVDPAGLVGDLTFRPPHSALAQARERAMRFLRRTFVDRARPPAPRLLALDWTGAREELLIGRHADCDVVLTDRSVSRMHAWLTFRAGAWVLRDLDSTNGTRVNGKRVVRCRLEPGDQLSLGSAHLLVD